MTKEAIKQSLNILKTNFQMKANLPLNEPKFQQIWQENKFYHKVLQKNSNNKSWILHDGPPYANGNLHVGHALNKILKDIIIRYKNAYGFYAPFLMGWDCHGLPIEHAIFKKMEKKYYALTAVEKRDLCYQFALDNIEIQKKQFAQFGLLTDYTKFYCTLTKDYEKRQLELFIEMIKKGLIYQAFKPVYWSWSSQTALAEAEIEYKDLISPSIYVKFNVTNGKNVLQTNDQLIIWTTTPWTLPANVAVAVHPSFEYLLVKYKNEQYVIGKTLLAKVVQLFKWDDYTIIKTIKGKELENVVYQHPLYPNKQCFVILANYVSDHDGTGLVHNAPSFGDDDYLACKKYNINPTCPLDKYACFNDELNDPELKGLFYEKANDVIISRLKQQNKILHHSEFTHSAPIDWRTKKPVIFRATKQWFVDITKVKSQIINALEYVQFINESCKKHMQEMIAKRNEWCISRQRVWGVPICLIYDQDEKPILDTQLLENILTILAKEGTNIWFSKPVEYFLTEKYKKHDYAKFTKCLDTMDVWFDSGSSHLMYKNTNCYPVNLYLEGNDQYRGWFNSSIITSIIINNFSPYRQLISHGMCVDEKKRKMSKSLGNGVDPLDIVKTYGADILRLWVANSNYIADVSISKNILNQIGEVYRKIRNSLFKFCLANISDFDYEKNSCLEFEKEDLFVLNKLTQSIKIINDAYKKFNFATIVRNVKNVVDDLSSWYFELIKDCLYCDEVNNKHRRAIQTILYLIVNTYVILLNPIIPHTCYEVYNYFNKTNKKESVFLEDWVKKIPFSFGAINQEEWQQIFKLKDLVFAKIEQLRNHKIINKNNEVDVILTFNNNNNISSQLLKKIFNVATVTINSVDVKNKEYDVKVEKTTKIKCQRCWNYFDRDEIADDLCSRCQEMMKKNHS